MSPFRLRPALSAFAIVLFVAQSGAALAHPLLVEDTSTVYQRVLTRPGAPLHEAPDGPETSRYPAFQPLYVFARQEGWIEVGPSATAAPAGWVAADTVVDWKQNIVATFTNPADRARSLMFRTEDDLRGFMEDEALVATQARLIEKAETGMLAPEDGVVAIEPENYVNIRDRFYILPILDFVEDLHPMTYDANLLLKVASVPLRDELPVAAAEASSSAGDFDAGVVFVFDTTKSMQPYIERTRKALARIIFDINGTDIGERINFGIEAFRDNPEAAPGLGYRTREVIPLERRINQLPVLEAIDNTRTATVSSPGFNEDSLAGVEDAIRRTDWDRTGSGDPFDARYVILVTDAGPKDPRDPNARSEIGPVEIQRDAEGRNIVIMTLHLKTDAGAANHDYAAERYRQLSRFAGRQFYYPIEGGSEQAFEDTVTALVTALTDHVRMALGQAQVLAPEDRDEDLEFLGHALQLAWLGAREGTRAPDVFESWVTEKAAEKPRALALEPRLLVTKNEMATMAELLDNLVRLAEGTRGEEEARGFFRQVRGVIAQMAQNPDRLVATDADSLGGALEYLERLPYRSQLLQTDEARWMSGPMVRREIIDGMRQKLTQYRKWLYDPSVWTALYEGAPDGEQVFAMPFDILP
ncbi:vWA domain-containing protein [Rhodovulum sulfidophilum]|uniref:VWA domain-containing protein n=1 Tax=Rhodovulum sulfidophilum TaxID=35806 RepID=A0ABS1RXX5_RHOSU|nr:vWA domain-containing protein [Rhodovulum sulfidophilum]MBL3610950.1 VWA domain-containing protein [Rhodovulum sulfidophilum]MCE8458452.1 VWA domain-containing protein [Rhodovulum sulfidophilum]